MADDKPTGKKRTSRSGEPRPTKRAAQRAAGGATEPTQQTHAPKAPLRSRPTGRASGAVVTMVCVTCGNELFFDVAPVTALKCPKCGGTVFRRFDTPSKNDQAAESAAEEQARSMSYGDSSPDTSPDEVRDLRA